MRRSRSLIQTSNACDYFTNWRLIWISEKLSFPLVISFHYIVYKSVHNPYKNTVSVPSDVFREQCAINYPPTLAPGRLALRPRLQKTNIGAPYRLVFRMILDWWIIEYDLCNLQCIIIKLSVIRTIVSSCLMKWLMLTLLVFNTIFIQEYDNSSN